MNNQSINAENESPESVLGDYIQGHVNNSDVPEVPNYPADDIYAKIMHEDHNALNKVLLETLNPQLYLNEEQKRKFKEDLMVYIKKILSFQILLVSLTILIVCIDICFDIHFMKQLDSSQIDNLFDFLKYYITAIIVEFIAMLFFIVKFVFDKSIVDLIKAMTNNKKKKKKRDGN